MFNNITYLNRFYQTNPGKPTNRNSSTPLLFGSTDKRTPNGSATGYYGHYSEMFRDDLQWDTLVNYIVENFPARTKLFVYASSDNSEALSLLLSLRKKIGVSDSRRFVPILVSDIVPDVVESARNGEIDLSERDIQKIRRYTGQSHKNFFTKVSDAAPVIGDTGEEPKEKYRVSQALLDDFNFRTADILEDAKSGKINGRSIVMFRNAWYHLEEKQKRELISDLYKNLEPGSLLICGRYEDLQSPEQNVYRLIRERFVPVEPEFSTPHDCYVFKRP